MSPQTHSNGSSPKQRRLLLIAQQTEKRQALYDFLRQKGFSIYAARSGEMALLILEFEQPDLILLDPQLSDTAAAPLIQKIRSLNPRTPLVVLGEAAIEGLNPDTAATLVRLPSDVTGDSLLSTLRDKLPVEKPAAQMAKAGTVLLIDDEERMCIIMQDFLTLNGFVVKTAASGEEGLALLSQGLPDAVMLDVRMPGMDGLVVLKKIRASFPRLPVILVTHVDEEATREEASQLGASGYVTKPFNFDGLKGALRQAIRQKPSSDQ